MSDIIRVLPDSVANQIAAGEVIQRPASVVKELVENAIDAEAKHVHVLITDAGKTSIQVIDDGKGMSETDARLSFERHATSKIREAADLFFLHTMGFRGEALASIAAVAQVELKTRMENEELGTFISIAGSKLQGQEPVSCAQGCNFTVNNLFFNVPARRKFLKSNQTELSNILTEFERIVLVHPDIAFTLHHNGSELFNLPVSPLRQRLIEVFGKKLNQQLLNLDVETSMVKISGFVGKPESSRKKGAHQYFFVNGRFMRHPYFHKAVMDAYEQLVPPGEQVSYFIYFEIDPSNIDVNIHPTKTEIKFENEQAIWQILAAAVKESLGKFNAIPTIDFDTEGRPDIPVFDASTYMEPPQVTYNPGYNPFTSSEDEPYVPPMDERTPSSPKRGGSAYVPSFDVPSVPSGWESLYEGAVSTDTEDGPAVESVRAGGSRDYVNMERSAQYFQFKGRYILTSVKSGLMIIEQTRAHVRVLYERYLSRIEKHQGYSQGVLFSEVVQFPPSEAVILEGITDDLASIGFDLSNLGGGSYAINGVPADIEGVDPSALLHELVNSAKEKEGSVKEEIHRSLALVMAKASAIVSGQVLSMEEMNGLVDDLFSCPTPNYTPDGKTVLAVITGDEIDRLF